MTAAQRDALGRLLSRYRFSPAAPRRYAPLHLEIGSGNGDNALELASRCAALEVIAAEVHRPGIGHTLLEIERRALRNLSVYDGDAVELLRACPAAMFDAIYVFFPDPWPKSRHHKRRLLNAELLELLATRLKRHGRLFCATDDADYARHIMTALAALATWENLAGTGKFAPRPRQRVVTRFEGRARAAGRTVYEVIAAPHDCAAPA